MWGCEAKKQPDGTWENPSEVPLIFDGEETYACPRQPVRENPAVFSHVFSVYTLYKKGLFLDAGAVMDQSAIYLDVMQIVDAAVSEANEEASKRGR